MYSIAFITPYFGTLPKQWFQLTLESCRYNSSIDWILITDDRTEYDYPDNVKVIYQSWSEFSDLIKCKMSEKLSIDPVLNHPYKLTDYKPLYGDLLQDYVKEYDFWGYTDISDVIYGNLRKFITDKDLEKFEKINFLGHLTLFKNEKNINQRYMLKMGEDKRLEYVFSSSENFAFDESKTFSIQSIYLDNEFLFKRKDEMVADISPLRYAFQMSKFDLAYNQYYEKYTPTIFLFESGTLIEKKKSVDARIIDREVGYVHFQKRKLVSLLDNERSSFIISPKGLLPTQPINIELIESLSPSRIYLPFFKLKWRAFLSKVKG